MASAALGTATSAAAWLPTGPTVLRIDEEDDFSAEERHFLQRLLQTRDEIVQVTRLPRDLAAIVAHYTLDPPAPADVAVVAGGADRAICDLGVVPFVANGLSMLPVAVGLGFEYGAVAATFGGVGVELLALANSALTNHALSPLRNFPHLRALLELTLTSAPGVAAVVGSVVHAPSNHSGDYTPLGEALLVYPLATQAAINAVCVTAWLARACRRWG